MEEFFTIETTAFVCNGLELFDVDLIETNFQDKLIMDLEPVCVQRQKVGLEEDK